MIVGGSLTVLALIYWYFHHITTISRVYREQKSKSTTYLVSSCEGKCPVGVGGQKTIGNQITTGYNQGLHQYLWTHNTLNLETPTLISVCKLYLIKWVMNVYWLLRNVSHSWHWCTFCWNLYEVVSAIIKHLTVAIILLWDEAFATWCSALLQFSH